MIPINTLNFDIVIVVLQDTWLSSKHMDRVHISAGQWLCNNRVETLSKGCGYVMMTSSNGNIFRVTGPLCGEITGPGEFPTQRPVTRSFDVFFNLCLNKRLNKQPWGWWFETPSWSLCHCNVSLPLIPAIDTKVLTLQRRHIERYSVSNHRRLDWLLKHYSMRRPKKISNLRATGLCEGNPPVTGVFPSQRESNAENVSIWWRHHDMFLHKTLADSNFKYVLKIKDIPEFKDART